MTFSNSHLSSEVQFYLTKRKRAKRRKKKNIFKVSLSVYVTWASIIMSYILCDIEYVQ